MLLPSALLGTAGAFSIWIPTYSRTVVKVIEGGLKFSVHRSIWEQVYLPIDQEKRGVAKALVDGMFARISEGIGSVVLYFWLLHAPLSLKNLNLNWISWIIICLIILWIGLTQHLSRIGCDDINPVET